MKQLKNILLIDDSDTDNEYHQMVIEATGVALHVDTITDSRKALTCWQNNCNNLDSLPDLVFLDINMPALNGFELLDRIRLNPQAAKLGNRLKVIMLTGSINPDDYKKATSKYADIIAGFQIKPLSAKSMNEIMLTHF